MRERGKNKMFVCPLCKAEFESAEELNLHFQKNDRCRGYAKKLMYSKSLLPTLDMNKRIDIFLKEYTGKPLKIKFARE